MTLLRLLIVPALMSVGACASDSSGGAPKAPTGLAGAQRSRAPHVAMNADGEADSNTVTFTAP